MKLVAIHSSSLPNVGTAVKECVNQGVWSLFSSTTQQRLEGTEYFLQAGQTVYELDSSGNVNRVWSDDGTTPDIQNLFHFQDLPQPASLSNRAAPSFSTSFSLMMA
jgi:hypothetical protein